MRATRGRLPQERIQWAYSSPDLRGSIISNVTKCPREFRRQPPAFQLSGICTLLHSVDDNKTRVFLGLFKPVGSLFFKSDVSEFQVRPRMN